MRNLLLVASAASLGLIGCGDPAAEAVACVDAPCPRTSDAEYVRLDTDGVELFWAQADRSCITLHLGAAEPFGTEALRAALTSAARQWTAAAESCQAALCLRVADAPAPAGEGLSAEDDLNVVRVVVDEAEWTRVPDAPPRVLGATVNASERNSGRIIAADIAINEAFHPFSARPEGPRRNENDLESVLLHEIGHLIGFGHTALGVDSIMAEQLGAGEARRSLRPVDVIGVCETFARPESAANRRRGPQPEPAPTPLAE